jgi:hypothetical protein
MRGAVIFVVVFLIFVFVTINYKELPPGRVLYGMLGVEDVQEEVQGVPATLLVVAVFNGVVYGFIVWLIFDILGKLAKSNKGSREGRSEGQ